MKAFKYVLMVLVLLANLVFAPPSFADAPKVTKSPEYKALTKEINKLRSVKDTQSQLEDYTPEQIENKLNELEFQKYILESGLTWGQCRNDTGKTLAVYGPPPANVDDDDFPYDAGLYFLGNGQTTQNNWDCQGVYIPSDVTAIALTPEGESQELTGGVVIKVPKGSNLVVSINQDTGAVEFNLPVAPVAKGDKVNWYVPKVSQAFLDTRASNAPTQS
ncbi:hypothetical protein BZZ01_03820 [Nostocales cyanobacterium HT-58-2]|nr:hypothetical protein BZZ01_03820 [Nostocales cyanobacterium HT-58-2]